MHDMNGTTKKTVFVGLSGGVDSSVAAARLLHAGYYVVGVFIKVWHPSFLHCNWEQERLDAMRVCATLGIPFLTCDATERYKSEVADYLVATYKAGQTPNPDVMCNKHVKFGAFLEFADAQGADYIATGHYAQRDDSSDAPKNDAGSITLRRGADPQKDQSYFLWTLSHAQLTRTLFPIGDTLKADIRTEAARYGLTTATKPDSQGVCFLGELDMKSFLKHFIPATTGAVVDTSGKIVGEHDGAVFYTVGQRHGFHTQQTSPDMAPYYIVAKNIPENILTVSHTKPVLAVHTPHSFTLSDTNWIGGEPPHVITIQTRYRQTPTRALVDITGVQSATITPTEVCDAPTPGQSCVAYDGTRCLGGGIITHVQTETTAV